MAIKVPSTLKISSLLTIFLLFIGAEYSHGLRHLNKETKITMFMQDYFGGPNTTDVLVAGIPMKEWYWLKFGTVAVTDNLMTQEIKPYSKPIARSQGMYTISSLDGANAQAQVTILFSTDGKYNGSTLELQGLFNQYATVAEISIVSGTGIFRFARGFVTIETLFYDLSIFYTVYRWNFTVLHYY